MKPWYERAFGEFYLRLYAHRDAGEARRVMDLLFPDAELEGLRVLDLACGPGRYLPEIERKGGSAVGLDLSMPLLREASTRLEGPRLVRADMRQLPFAEASVDWVLSLFTSFGYFEDIQDHCRLAAEWARVARRGLVLDVPNPETLVASLVPESRREEGPYRIEESRVLESNPARVVKTVRVFSADGAPAVEYAERVMLFDASQLEMILEEAGWRLTRRFGDYEGSEFEAQSSPRQLLVCERKDRIR